MQVAAVVSVVLVVLIDQDHFGTGIRLVWVVRHRLKTGDTLVQSVGGDSGCRRESRVKKEEVTVRRVARMKRHPQQTPFIPGADADAFGSDAICQFEKEIPSRSRAIQVSADKYPAGLIHKEKAVGFSRRSCQGYRSGSRCTRRIAEGVRGLKTVNRRRLRHLQGRVRHALPEAGSLGPQLARQNYGSPKCNQAPGGVHGLLKLPAAIASVKNAARKPSTAAERLSRIRPFSHAFRTRATNSGQP